MKYVNKKLFFLIFPILFTLTVQAHAFTVGAIVGQKSSVSSTSNAEKMCILSNMYDSAKATNPGLEIIFEENDRSARGSVEAALKLVEEKVDIALLPLISSEAEPAADILAENGIPFVATATSESVIKNNRLGLSLFPENSYQADLLVDYYLRAFSGRSVHIVTDESSNYSMRMGKIFTQKLLEKQPDTQIDELKLNSRDFNFEHSRKASMVHEGDVLFAPIFNPKIAMLYTWLSSLDIKNISIIGPDSIGARREFYDIVGEIDENVDLYFLKNWNNEMKGPHRNTLNSYVKAYCPNQKGTFVTTYSFDLINTILTGYPLLKSEKGESLISFLRSSDYISTMDGSTYHFSESGYNRKPMYLYKASNEGNLYIETF